jgi:hypothetical protein
VGLKTDLAATKLEKTDTFHLIINLLVV